MLRLLTEGSWRSWTVVGPGRACSCFDCALVRDVRRGSGEDLNGIYPRRLAALPTFSMAGCMREMPRTLHALLAAPTEKQETSLQTLTGSQPKRYTIQTLLISLNIALTKHIYAELLDERLSKLTQDTGTRRTNEYHRQTTNTFTYFLACMATGGRPPSHPVSRLCSAQRVNQRESPLYECLCSLLRKRQSKTNMIDIAALSSQPNERIPGGHEDGPNQKQCQLDWTPGGVSKARIRLAPSPCMALRSRDGLESER